MVASAGLLAIAAIIPPEIPEKSEMVKDNLMSSRAAGNCSYLLNARWVHIVAIPTHVCKF